MNYLIRVMGVIALGLAFIVSAQAQTIQIDRGDYREFFFKNKTKICQTLARQAKRIYPAYHGGSFGVLDDKKRFCHYNGPTFGANIVVFPELGGDIKCTGLTSGSVCTAPINFYCNRTAAGNCRGFDRPGSTVRINVNSAGQITKMRYEFPR